MFVSFFQSCNDFLILFTDSSSLFLSANSFKKPYEYLSHEETKKMVQVYLTYLNDNTDLINNPGIRVCISLNNL